MWQLKSLGTHPVKNSFTADYEFNKLRSCDQTSMYESSSPLSMALSLSVKVICFQHTDLKHLLLPEPPL